LADWGVADVVSRSPRQIFSAAFLRTLAVCPSTAVPHRCRNSDCLADESWRRDWTLSRQRSTIAAFERLLGRTGVVATDEDAPAPAAEEPELEADFEFDPEAGLAAVALAASVLVLTAADVAGELEVEELPQPARTAPARIATVTHIDGMRRNAAPLL